MTAKRLLIIAGLIVAALAIGLIVSLRSAEAPSAREVTASTAPSPSTTSSGSSSGSGDSATATGSAVPPATPVTPEVKRPEPSPPVAPVDDDDEPAVRDHRGMGPSGTPSPLRSVTVASVRKALEPGIRACVADLKVESPGARFVVHSTVRVTAGRITTRDVSVTGAETFGPDFLACVTRVYDGLSASASSDQPDGEDLVHMPWTAP